MSSRVWGRGIVAAVAASLLLAGCASAGGSTSSNESSGGSAGALSGQIKLGSPLSLTGAAAFAGISEKQGMDFAIQQINDQHYLGDATLSAQYVDVAVDTNQAIAAVRGFAGDTSVEAVVGNTLSNHALAIAPVAQQGQIPLLVANTGGLDNLTTIGPFVYQIDVRQSSYASKMGDVLKSKGVKNTAAVVNDDVPAITSLWSTYTGSVLPKSGIKVDNVQKLPSTATDFSAVVTSVMAGNPQAIAIMTRAGTIPIITALRHAGYKGVIWGQAGLAGGVAANAAPVTEGVLFTANAAPGSNIPSMQKFFTAYQQQYGKDAYAFAAQGYDAVWAVARAAKNAGCTSRSCIQKGLTQLMKTGFDGALGPLKFSDRNAVGPGAIVEIKEGKETFVK